MSDIERELERVIAEDRRFDDSDVGYSSEIGDTVVTHVRDNGASQQVEDNEPYNGDGGDSAFQTDQEHLFDQIGQSQIGPDGEHLEELDAKFQLREMRKREERERAPFANINPESADGGSLGLTTSVPAGVPTTAAGLPVTLAMWPGQDGECRPCTITWGPQLPLVNPVAATGISRVKIRIVWATGSGSFTMDVDGGNGGQLVIAASSIIVSAYLDVGSTVACNVGASITFGPSTKNNQATRTAYNDAQGTGAANVVTNVRPNFAVSLAGFERQFYNAQYILTFLDQNNNQIGQRILAPNSMADLALPILLPDDVRAIQVENDGGQAGSSRLVWGMAA